MSLYVGQNGTPKKVSKLLVGVNGTAKEVKTGYTGNTSSNSQLVYQSFNADAELTKVNPVSALTSGKFKSSDIGKTVYLSNSYTTCQEWRIADINHDGTSGTVDLWPKYVLHCDDTGKSPYMYYFAYDEDETYEYSPLRTVLNNYIYNGFTSDVQNAMKTQSFVSDGSNRTLYDKVKCPSVNELGYNNDSTKYPLFSDVSGGKGSSITLYTTFGTTGNLYENRPVGYWTRTLSSSHYVWIVDMYGSGAISLFTTCYVGSKNAVAAIIRF